MKWKRARKFNDVWYDTTHKKYIIVQVDYMYRLLDGLSKEIGRYATLWEAQKKAEDHVKTTQS